MYWFPNFLAVVFKKQEISQQVVTRMQDLASKFSKIFRGDTPGPFDTGAPGIISDWCIYGIRAVYGFFSRLRATPVLVGHQAGTCWVIFPPGNGADWATFPADSVYQPRVSRPLVGGTGGNGHWCVGELISR